MPQHRVKGTLVLVKGALIDGCSDQDAAQDAAALYFNPLLCVLFKGRGRMLC